VTLAPCLASVVPITRDVVLFPVPPFGLLTTMTGMTCLRVKARTITHNR
jgi:hypothetical protein